MGDYWSGSMQTNYEDYTQKFWENYYSYKYHDSLDFFSPDLFVPELGYIEFVSCQPYDKGYMYFTVYSGGVPKTISVELSDFNGIIAKYKKDGKEYLLVLNEYSNKAYISTPYNKKISITLKDDYIEFLYRSAGLPIPQNIRKEEKISQSAGGKATCVFYGRKGARDIDASEWNRVVEANPESAIAWFNRGNAYYDSKKYGQAISDYTKALEIKPGWAMVYYNRASAYDFKDQYNQSIKDYTKYLEINPGDNYAYNNRGVAYYHRGHYDKAISDYNKALDMIPDYMSYYNKAVACEDAGRTEEAAASYRQFVAYDPGERWADEIEYARMVIAKTSTIHTRTSTTSRFNEVSSEERNSGNKDYELACKYNDLGVKYAEERLAEAVELFLKALDINPAFLDARHNLAVYYFKNEDYSKALIEWEVINGIEPNFPNLKRNLGLVRKKLNED